VSVVFEVPEKTVVSVVLKEEEDAVKSVVFNLTPITGPNTLGVIFYAIGILV
jgi:hypothetical protein